MKLHLCMKLAVRNMLNQKKVFINMLIGFGIIAFIIASNAMYLKVLDNGIHNLEHNSISKNYLSVSCNKSDISWSKLNEIKNLAGVSDIQVSTDDLLCVYMKKIYGGVNVNGYIPIEKTSLQLGNDLYYGKSISDFSLEKNDLTFQEMNLRCDANFMVENYSKISSTELKEFKNKYGENEFPFLYGTEPVSSNQIAVSDYFLNRYGISKESYKNLIGSNVAIFYNLPDDTAQVALKDVVLTGIIDSRFFTISSRKNTPHMFVTLGQKIPSDNYRIKIFGEL